MADAQTILIVDDDPAFTEVLCRALSRRGFLVETANSAEQALELLDDIAPDRAILDLKMTGASGLTLIPTLKERFPALEILILTGYSSIATAVEAMKLGACNYLCKPASVEEILAAFEDQSPNPQQEPAAQPPSLDRLEWEHIQKVLTENDGNISATARQLGMHRRTLQRKLQKRPVKR